MQYDRFVGLVQNRARLPTNGDAVAAIRATLTTLAERIDPGEAHDLAAQLPREIGFYLKANPIAHGERFSFKEFCHRIAERECCDLPVAVYHARCVIEVMSEAVTPGELRDVRSQLPAEFQALFESGSRGHMKIRDSRGSREEMPSAASQRWSERRAMERQQAESEEPEDADIEAHEEKRAVRHSDADSDGREREVRGHRPGSDSMSEQAPTSETSSADHGGDSHERWSESSSPRRAGAPGGRSRRERAEASPARERQPRERHAAGSRGSSSARGSRH